MNDRATKCLSCQPPAVSDSLGGFAQCGLDFRRAGRGADAGRKVMGVEREKNRIRLEAMQRRLRVGEFLPVLAVIVLVGLDPDAAPQTGDADRRVEVGQRARPQQRQAYRLIGQRFRRFGEDAVQHRVERISLHGIEGRDAASSTASSHAASPASPSRRSCSRHCSILGSQYKSIIAHAQRRSCRRPGITLFPLYKCPLRNILAATSGRPFSHNWRHSSNRG